jgi:hypothetical protein
MSSSKSAALQQQYLEDERKSYFLVKHPRGQKVALIDRVLQPLSQPSKLDGQTINFKIAKVNHMVDAITLMFDCVVTKELMARLAASGDLESGAFSLVDLPAIRAIEEIQVHYGGDVINKFNSDAIRWDMHLFKTDAQKTAMRQAATDYSRPFVCKDMRLPEQTGNEAYAFSFRGARGMDYMRPRDIDTGHLSFSPMSFKVADMGNTTNVNGSAMTAQSRTRASSTASDLLFENAVPAPFDSDEFGVGANNVNFGTIYGLASSFYGHSSVAPASRTFGAYSVDTGSLTEDIVLHWEVELPWTHGMSPDRNLPVVLLDNEPQIQVRFRETAKLIWAVSSGLALSGQDLFVSLKGEAPTFRVVGLPLLQSDFTVDKLYMNNARLRVSYREQSAALINALGSEPSITYPLSSYQSERVSLNPGAYTVSDIPINSIRGLVHTVGFAVRDQNSVNGCPNLHGNSFNVRWMTMGSTGAFRDISVTTAALTGANGFTFESNTGNTRFGYHDITSYFDAGGVAVGPSTINTMVIFRQAYDSARRYFGTPPMNAAAVALMHPNPSPVALYDYDFLDMSSVQTDVYAGSSATHKKVVMPGGQRMVEEWWIEANGERITGKEPINALYGLTTYKTKHFPAHTELARHYAGDMHGNNEAAPCGLNLHVWTFGMDGDRAAVGSGTLNFDGLQSVKLHIKWYENVSPVVGIAPSASQLSAQTTAGLLTNAIDNANTALISYATSTVAAQLAGSTLGFPGVDNNSVPTFIKKTGRFAQEQLYIDLFAFGANFTTISGGNWFRQLTL